MRTTGKPFNISKRQVTKPTKRSNPMVVLLVSMGRDRTVRSRLEEDLYKLWNRMSSGNYFPPPVRAVSIPKKTGGQRILGVPTVADRVAQMVGSGSSSQIWIPYFWRTPTDTGRESRRLRPSGSRASGAGNTIGF